VPGVSSDYKLISRSAYSVNYRPSNVELVVPSTHLTTTTEQAQTTYQGSPRTPARSELIRHLRLISPDLVDFD
jgi:hypothetical protein